MTKKLEIKEASGDYTFEDGFLVKALAKLGYDVQYYNNKNNKFVQNLLFTLRVTGDSFIFSLLLLNSLMENPSFFKVVQKKINVISDVCFAV